MSNDLFSEASSFNENAAPKKTMMTIEEQWYHIMAAIDEADGEITDEVAAMLTINNEDFQSKLDAYAYRIRSLKGKNEVINDEIDRLSKRKATNDKLAEKLKNVIFEAMQFRGLTKVQTEKNNFAIANSGAALDYKSINGVPINEWFKDAAKDFMKEVIENNADPKDLLVLQANVTSPEVIAKLKDTFADSSDFAVVTTKTNSSDVSEADTTTIDIHTNLDVIMKMFNDYTKCDISFSGKPVEIARLLKKIKAENKQFIENIECKSVSIDAKSLLSDIKSDTDLIETTFHNLVNTRIPQSLRIK